MTYCDGNGLGFSQNATTPAEPQQRPQQNNQHHLLPTSTPSFVTLGPAASPSQRKAVHPIHADVIRNHRLAQAQADGQAIPSSRLAQAHKPSRKLPPAHQSSTEGRVARALGNLLPTRCRPFFFFAAPIEKHFLPQNAHGSKGKRSTGKRSSPTLETTSQKQHPPASPTANPASEVVCMKTVKAYNNDVSHRSFHQTSTVDISL